MRKLVLLFIILLPILTFAQSKTLTAQNGQTYKIAGTDGFRGNDELWIYSTGYYLQKPTSNAGIDVYVVENKVVEIRDRAGAVFIENKPDPGVLKVGKDGFVISGNGAGRRWILANLKVGDSLSLDGKIPASSDPYFYPGFGMIQTANNQTLYLNGKNAARSANFVIYYTPDFYAKTPPNETGVDILVTNGKVEEIRDRADAVFIQKKSDPGVVQIADPANSFVISGNGEGRKWLIENIKTGEEIRLSGIDNKEVTPLSSSPCFNGAYYRKAVSSYDLWTGIGGLVKLGTPKFDEDRKRQDKNQYLDNFSVYMGGNAGGKFEVDAGLSWEFTVDESGKKSEKRNAFRPFWRTKTWNAAPAKKEFYFYPGETVQMAILVAGPKKLRLIISDGKTKTFQTEFEAEGFVAGLPRQFKRVNAIDQFGNEGKPVQPTKAEITGAEWLQTILIRGEGASAQQLPMNSARFTDMRCSDKNVVISGRDASKGAEKIDILGTSGN